jgi:hypothetical protein
MTISVETERQQTSKQGIAGWPPDIDHEREAFVWIEGLVGDVADEPID